MSEIFNTLKERLSEAINIAYGREIKQDHINGWLYQLQKIVNSVHPLGLVDYLSHQGENRLPDGINDDTIYEKPIHSHTEEQREEIQEAEIIARTKSGHEASSVALFLNNADAALDIMRDLLVKKYGVEIKDDAFKSQEGVERFFSDVESSSLAENPDIDVRSVLTVILKSELSERQENKALTDADVEAWYESDETKAEVVSTAIELINELFGDGDRTKPVSLRALLAKIPNWLGNYGIEDFGYHIMQYLSTSENTKNTKVIFATQEEMQARNPGDTDYEGEYWDMYEGSWDKESDIIYIHLNRGLLLARGETMNQRILRSLRRTLLHEALHPIMEASVEMGWIGARHLLDRHFGTNEERWNYLEDLTGQKLDRENLVLLTELYRNLDDIRREVAEQTDEFHYGLTDTKEFAIEILASDDLKKLLSGIKLSSELRARLGITKSESWVKTLFDAIIVSILRLFGAKGTALEDSLNTVREILLVGERAKLPSGLSKSWSGDGGLEWYEVLLRDDLATGMSLRESFKTDPNALGLQIATYMQMKARDTDLTRPEDSGALRSMRVLPSKNLTREIDENVLVNKIKPQAAAGQEFRRIASAAYRNLQKAFSDLQIDEFKKMFGLGPNPSSSRFIRTAEKIQLKIPDLSDGPQPQRKQGVIELIRMVEAMKLKAREHADAGNQHMEAVKVKEAEGINMLKGMQEDLSMWYGADFVGGRAKESTRKIIQDTQNRISRNEFNDPLLNEIKEKGGLIYDSSQAPEHGPHMEVLKKLLDEDVNFWYNIMLNVGTAGPFRLTKDDLNAAVDLALGDTDYADDPAAKALLSVYLRTPSAVLVRGFVTMQTSRNKNLPDIQKMIQQISVSKEPETLEDAVGIYGDASNLLKALIAVRRGVIDASKQIEVFDREVRIAKDMQKFLFPVSVKFREYVGELEPFTFGDGATILTVGREPDGDWTLDDSGTPVILRHKVVFKNDMTVEDREATSKAINNNLRFIGDKTNEAKYKNEYWFTLMKDQTKATQKGLVEKEYTEAKMYGLTSWLSSMEHHAEKLGYTGKNVAAMMSRTRQIILEHRPKWEAAGKRWSRALLDLANDLDVTMHQARDGILKQSQLWLENHAEYFDDERVAFEELWKHLLEWAYVDRTILTANVKQSLIKLLSVTKLNQGIQEELSTKLGNRVMDKGPDGKWGVWVQSLVDPDKMVPLYREPIRRGWLTGARRLDDRLISLITKDMSSWPDLADAINDKEVTEEALSTEEGLEGLIKMVRPYLTDHIVAEFIKPYVTSTVAVETFSKPLDEYGNRTPLPQSKSAQLWKEAENESSNPVDQFFTWMRLVHDGTKNESEGAFMRHTLNIFMNQYRKISRHNQRADASLAEGLGLQSLVSHKMMDSRDIRTNYPHEFFNYDSYDDISMKISLGLIAANSSFGRDAENILSETANLNRVTKERSAEYIRYIQSGLGRDAISSDAQEYKRVTGKKRQKVIDTISREKKLSKNGAREYFDALEAGMKTNRDHNRLRKNMKVYFGGQDGPFKDFQLTYELLGFHSYMLLNQPKSGFINLLSIKAFPTVFKGMNQMALRGGWGAMLSVADQFLGGATEALGLEVWKNSEYNKDIEDIFLHLGGEDLEFRDYILNIGRGGAVSGNTEARIQMGTRTYRDMMKYTPHAMAVEERTRKPLHWKTMLPLVGDPFGYLSALANHAIAIGTIKAYAYLVKRAAGYIERQGIPRGDELHASELGFDKESAGEKLLFGGAQGYDFMVDRLISNGMPTITQLAHDYLERRAEGDTKVISKENAIGMAYISMSDISLEGPGAKPGWMYDTPTRYFMNLLGWSFSASGQVGESWRDSTTRDKHITAHSLIKWLAVMGSIELPLSMIFMSLWDWYDEEVTGKPSSLPKVSPVNHLPFAAGWNLMTNGKDSTAIIERAARSGVGGIVGEALSGMITTIDPERGGKPLSIDTRVVLASVWHNLQQIIANAVVVASEGGSPTWANFGRQATYLAGGNGAIQAIQALTHLVPPLGTAPVLEKERQVADYLGIKASIKNAAKADGHALLTVSGREYRPTRLSYATREMLRTSIANDRDGFMKAYEEAKAAATQRGERNVTQYVYQKFKARNLRSRVIDGGKMSDEEWSSMLQHLTPDLRAKVVNAEMNYNSYLVYIEPIAIPKPVSTRRRDSALRRQRDDLMQEMLY